MILKLHFIADLCRFSGSMKIMSEVSSFVYITPTHYSVSNAYVVILLARTKIVSVISYSSSMKDYLLPSLKFLPMKIGLPVTTKSFKSRFHGRLNKKLLQTK